MSLAILPLNFYTGRQRRHFLQSSLPILLRWLLSLKAGNSLFSTSLKHSCWRFVQVYYKLFADEYFLTLVSNEQYLLNLWSNTFWTYYENETFWNLFIPILSFRAFSDTTQTQILLYIHSDQHGSITEPLVME